MAATGCVCDHRGDLAAMRVRVHEALTQRMDTGVVVNWAYQKAMQQRSGAHAAASSAQNPQSSDSSDSD